MGEYFRIVANGLGLPGLQRLILLAVLDGGQGTNKRTIKMREFQAFTGLSPDAIRRNLRELAMKGVLGDLTPTRNGFEFRLCDTDEISGLPRAVHFQIELTVDDIDFFDRQRLPSLLERQAGRCIYSRALLSPESAELDHVVPQSAGGSGSHRNIVACTFEMNKAKGSREAEVFLRDCFRRGFLSEPEFEEQLALLRSIVAGERPPSF